MTSTERSDIDKRKLLFVSIFVFLLSFPYSIWGYLCFFPDIFSVIFSYWLVSYRTSFYTMMFVCGTISALRVIFGGEFFFSVFMVLTAFFVSLFPWFIRDEFSSALRITLILSLIWSVLKFPFGEDFLFSVLCVLAKILITFVFALCIFPFVKSERKDRFVFWTP